MKLCSFKRFTLFGGALLILLVAATLHSLAQRAPRSQPTMPSLVKAKEQLIYSVHYGFLTLGEVILEEVRDTLYQGKKAHYSRTIIRSNPSIPFVGRKERHFHSIFAHNDTIAYGLNFWTDSVHDNEYFDSRYIFDYEKGKVFIFEFEEPTDTLALDGPADSGPTLHLITRLYAGMNAKRTYPIYISNEKGDVEMTYTSRIDQISTEAFSGPVSAYYSFGNANLKGPFGFSGAYKAWHMTNDSRIPLEAHVRVWVGNVKVKLKSYGKQ
jgi:hypothetical protein